MTLSIGPAPGIEPATSPSAVKRSTDWANPAAVNGVKADRLSSVRWKAILYVHCTDRVTVAAYRCIEEDNFTVNCKRCLISPSLFEASAVGVLSEASSAPFAV